MSNLKLKPAEAAMMLGILRSRFPWLGFDDMDANGADTVDQLNELRTDLQSCLEPLAYDDDKAEVIKSIKPRERKGEKHPNDET